MSNGTYKLGLLVIGNPIALADLAEGGQLDRLLGYRHIVIPDLTAYEANRRFAAAHVLDDPDRLQRWINEQIAAGRVSRPPTWLGELAARLRREGAQWTPTDLGTLAAIQYIRHRDRAADQGSVTFLIDDMFMYRRFETDDIKNVDTRSMLTALGYPVD